MDDTKGAYIYRDDKDNDIILFMYFKMTEEKLKQTFPDSYNSESAHGSNYLITNFKNGKDYIGCGTMDNIKRFMNDTEMSDIIENNFETTQKIFNNLTEEQYNILLSFAEKTLGLV